MSTRQPASQSPPTKLFRLRAALIQAAKALADELRPQWAGGTAVVTVLIQNGEGQAAVRFPSARE
jgi:hypothetical protein